MNPVDVVATELRNSGYVPVKVILVDRERMVFSASYHDQDHGILWKAHLRLLPGGHLIALDFGTA